MKNQKGIETSKTFIKMGNIVGIKAERKSQRGIIAKNFMPIITRYEIEVFTKSFVQLKPRTDGILFTSYNEDGGEYL